MEENEKEEVAKEEVTNENVTKEEMTNEDSSKQDGANEEIIKEDAKPKKKKKKIVIITILVIIILLAICVAFGIYYFLREQENKISDINSKQERCLLELTDNINYGQEIVYEDLVSKLIDMNNLQQNTKISIEINDNPLNNEEKYTFNELGTYTIKVRLEYTYNYPFINSMTKLIKNEKVTEITIQDTEKPVITGVSNKEIIEGNEINLLEGISATDNVDGEIEVKIEGSVDNTKPGEYTIKVTATDKSGNTQEETFIVTVKQKPVVQTQTQNNNKKSNNNNSNNKNNAGNNTVTRREFTREELLAEATTAKATYRSQINAVLNCTNAYRREVQAKDLQLDEELTTAACMRAIEMAYSGIFSHTRPDGTDCFTVLEGFNIYSSLYTEAENIAYGQNTPEGAAQTWRNSPGHYFNMTMPLFGRIGIGAFKLNGVYYWVQIFAN